MSVTLTGGNVGIDTLAFFSEPLTEVEADGLLYLSSLKPRGDEAAANQGYGAWLVSPAAQRRLKGIVFADSTGTGTARHTPTGESVNPPGPFTRDPNLPPAPWARRDWAA